MLAQIGGLQNQYLKEMNDFKKALNLYIKPCGTWHVPIFNGKEIKYKKGDVGKKNSKIIITCRPEYLDEGYEKKSSGLKKMVEIEQYVKKYFDYSKKK
ncbi:19526_t:CDS:2, partial [Gigaspora rosea]